MHWVEQREVERLGQLLGGPESAGRFQTLRSETAWSKWKMEIHDAPILRAIFKTVQPRRHLEFGTWQGFGTLCCLEETDATVWTINLLGGEIRGDGSWAYGQKLDGENDLPVNSVTQTFTNDDNPEQGPHVYHQTDSYGFIGRLYLNAGYGPRVNQIYCDSRAWNVENYPEGFFDTVFIDGGHAKDVVTSDTDKALRLLRPGGVVIWHDFCPNEEFASTSKVVSGVNSAIDAMRPKLEKELGSLFWVDRSLMLVGVK